MFPAGFFPPAYFGGEFAPDYVPPDAALIYERMGPGSRPAPVRRGSRQVFARGDRARAGCPRCGFVVPYADIKPDWQGKMVCGDCRDQRPPAVPIVPADAQALRNPRPWKQHHPVPARVEEQVPPPMNVKPDFFS